jgi:hypothetical protein
MPWAGTTGAVVHLIRLTAGTGCSHRTRIAPFRLVTDGRSYLVTDGRSCEDGYDEIPKYIPAGRCTYHSLGCDCCGQCELAWRTRVRAAAYSSGHECQLAADVFSRNETPTVTRAF